MCPLVNQWFGNFFRNSKNIYISIVKEIGPDHTVPQILCPTNFHSQETAELQMKQLEEVLRWKLFPAYNNKTNNCNASVCVICMLIKKAAVYGRGDKLWNSSIVTCNCASNCVFWNIIRMTRIKRLHMFTYFRMKMQEKLNF